MIQLADLVAFSIYRHFQEGDSQFYEVIENCFDSAGGTKHGLYVRGKLPLAKSEDRIANTTLVTTEIVETTVEIRVS